MSMLAERKRKQKWCLNPRGKIWSEDTAKFGHKMLEKMGWSNGKGLGPEENGITEHIKISYKNDSKGMGFKETNDQWTEHEDKFSELLQQLTDCPETIKIETDNSAIKSLEEKSQKSRARVHYHKFTRGKDLSRYSETDIANIFGRKTLKNPKTKHVVAETGADDLVDKRFGVETVTGGSMVDYFKNKFNPNFMSSNGFKVGKNGVLEKCDEYNTNFIKSELSRNKLDNEMECDEHQGFGFGFNSNTSIGHSDLPKSEPIVDELENKMHYNGHQGFGFGLKGNKSSGYTNFVKSEPIVDKLENKLEYGIIFANKKETLNSVVDQEEIGKAKKKRKKNKKLNEDSLEASKTEDMVIKNEIINYEVEPIDETNEETPKKKKKKSKLTPDSVAQNISKKSKKDKQKCNGIFNPIVGQEIIEDFLPQNVYKKKSKKDKPNVAVIGNPGFNPTFSQEEIEDSLPQYVSIKKSKKDKQNCVGLTNPGFNPIFGQEEMEDSVPQNVSTKKSKKDKQNCNGLTNPGFNPIFGQDEMEDSVPQNVSMKKSKKDRQNCNGLTNPGFNPIFGQEEMEDSIPQNVSMKKSKKGWQNCNGLTNPGFNPIFSQEEMEDTVQQNVSTKKSKKGGQNCNGFTNPGFNPIFGQEEMEDSVPQNVSMKKSKKGGQNCNGFTNPGFNPIFSHEEMESSVSQNVALKKSKKDKENCVEMVNPGFIPLFSQEIVEKRDKKLKKKNKRKFEEMSVEEAEICSPLKKKKKKSKLHDSGISNSCFDDDAPDESLNAQGIDNPFEIKPKKKKTKKGQAEGLDNPIFSVKSDEETKATGEQYEIKRKNQVCLDDSSSIGLDNPCLNLTDMEINCDFTINTVIEPVKPVIKTPNVKLLQKATIKRRKSVRFSDVNEERIIPNNDENKKLSLEDIAMRNELFDINTKVLELSLEKQRKNASTTAESETGFVNNAFDIKSIDNCYETGPDVGVINAGFDTARVNVENIAKDIDAYEAEIENDLNEAKAMKGGGDEIMIGETSCLTRHVTVSNGVRLSFQNVSFQKIPSYLARSGEHIESKKSYKHLIKGDIILGFPNTNLHEIDGYGHQSKNKRDTKVL